MILERIVRPPFEAWPTRFMQRAERFAPNLKLVSLQGRERHEPPRPHQERPDVASVITLEAGER
jgi:hypothetical protein